MDELRRMLASAAPTPEEIPTHEEIRARAARQRRRATALLGLFAIVLVAIAGGALAMIQTNKEGTAVTVAPEEDPHVLADALYQGGWTQDPPFGIEFNYTSQSRDGAARPARALVSLSLVRTDEEWSGPAMRLRYAIFDRDEDATTYLQDSRRALSSSEAPELMGLRSIDGGYCYELRPTLHSCLTVERRVVIEAQVTWPFRRFADDVQVLLDLGVQHLNAVQRGHRASPLPTTPPPTPHRSANAIDTARRETPEGLAHVVMQIDRSEFLVGETPELLLRNRGDVTVAFGEPYVVERSTGDRWEEIALPKGQGWHALLHVLGPGETSDPQAVQIWERAGDEKPFAPGTYRVTKSVSLEVEGLGEGEDTFMLRVVFTVGA